MILTVLIIFNLPYIIVYAGLVNTLDLTLLIENVEFSNMINTINQHVQIKLLKKLFMFTMYSFRATFPSIIGVV